MIENKYGWNHAPNGAWHPVGIWIPWPDAEAKAKEDEDCPFSNSDPKYDDYHKERNGYLNAKQKYNKLVSRWQKNPKQWFKVSRGISFTPTVGFGIDVGFMDFVEFRTDLTEADMERCYCVPKTRRITDAIYGPDRDKIVHGLKEHHWDWRVKLDMKNGVLVATEFRALPKLLDEICLDFQYEKKKEISAAIAKESSNGKYIAQTKQAGWFRRKDGKSGEWLVIQYDILNGQARGYQGALFFDESDSRDLRRRQQFEQAFGLEKDELPKLRRTRYWGKHEKHTLFLKKNFKAHFDFRGKYVEIENPCKVTESEVEPWL